MHATDPALLRVNANDTSVRPTAVAIELCPTQTAGNARHIFLNGLLRRLALSLRVCFGLCSSGLASFIFLVLPLLSRQAPKGVQQLWDPYLGHAEGSWLLSR